MNHIFMIYLPLSKFGETNSGRNRTFRSEPFRSRDISVRLWNLTLIQRRAVWFKARYLHHHTVGYQRSRNTTQCVLSSWLAISASAVSKVFYSA